jgi:hypothetical protein
VRPRLLLTIVLLLTRLLLLMLMLMLLLLLLLVLLRGRRLPLMLLRIPIRSRRRSARTAPLLLLALLLLVLLLRTLDEPVADRVVEVHARARRGGRLAHVLQGKMARVELGARHGRARSLSNKKRKYTQIKRIREL